VHPLSFIIFPSTHISYTSRRWADVNGSGTR
jgi:hypothetical protein